MFREKLHNDLDGISPDEELLSKISAMMTEEAKKPKQPIYMNVVKWGGMAAAICLIAVGAVAFTSRGGNSLEAAADAAGIVAEDKGIGSFAETKAPNADMADGMAYGLDSDDICMEAEAAEYSLAECAEEDCYSDGACAETKSETDMLSPIVLPEYANKGFYKNIITNPSVRGPEAAYEEIINGRFNEIDSFYLIKITGLVDKAETADLKGYNIDIDEFAFFYTAVIEYDYLTQTPINEEIILRIPYDEGCPPYCADDKIAVVLQKKSDDQDFRKRFSYVFNYDIYEIGGVSYAAVRSQRLPEAEAELTDYFGGKIVEYETTTPANPAVYYGLYEIEGIADNLRRLFSE